VAIQIGAWSVAASSTAAIFEIPPGPVSVTFWNAGTQAVYIGATSAGTNVNNSLQCHSIPTSFNTWPFSKGLQLFATTGNGTAASIQYIVSTAQ
jgi:hypothetical protein